MELAQENALLKKQQSVPSAIEEDEAEDDSDSEEEANGSDPDKDADNEEGQKSQEGN